MGEESIKIIIKIFYVTFVIFIGGMIIFVYEFRKRRRKHTQEIEKLDTLYKKELAQTQAEIQTETMRHIGREIHDNVGQKLTLSSLYLQQLVFENKAPQISENISAINDIINESLFELRSLSKSLTNDTIEQYSLATLIEEECKKTHGLKTYDIQFQNHTKGLQLSYQIKSILVRITQECIQNSIKHAQCSTINITLSNTDTKLELEISDDGKGFDIETMQTNGIGLKNIKKRIDIIKGTFVLKSTINKGTSVILNVPLP
ncbi:sensor histidine kinase [uncultured Kordia sp.]|uniref:sensor histidine kinase n=1 Tax=uncultured Kordia sp. TaxID=507699 RepID=UPI0026313F58|nr:sensor histidine kinase [uncultured Kordia sp.]